MPVVAPAIGHVGGVTPQVWKSPPSNWPNASPPTTATGVRRWVAESAVDVVAPAPGPIVQGLAAVLGEARGDAGEAEASSHRHLAYRCVAVSDLAESAITPAEGPAVRGYPAGMFGAGVHLLKRRPPATGAGS